MLAQIDRMANILARVLAATGVAFLFGLMIFPTSLSHAQDDGEERRQQFLEDLRCVGCDPSPQGKWPWQVFLIARWKQPSGEFAARSCGGSIIWRGWVLSAAHCVVDDKGIVADAAAIVAGNVDRTKGDSIDVQRILPHEKYDPATAVNDVAVLQLATDYGDDRWIAIADDDTDAKLASPGQTATIAGWGATWDPRLLSELLPKDEQSRVTEPVTLHDAEVGIIDRRLCQARYQEAAEAAAKAAAEAQGSSYRVTDNHICAGEMGKGVCVGDSGGPLIVKAPNRSGYIQIGIGSWVMRLCGDPGFPGVFTRVSRYRDWIANKITGPPSDKERTEADVP